MPTGKITTAICLALLAISAKAQFTPPVTVGPVKVFNAVTTAQASATVPNLGQSVHYFTYTTSGTITALSVELEGSNDGINWLRISDTATNTSSGALFATCYLTFIHPRITLISGGGSLTGWYTGTSVSSGPPVGAFTQSGTNLLTLGLGQAANTTKTFSVNLTQAGTGGVIYFLYHGTPPVGGSIGVTAGPDASHLASALAATVIAAVSTVQTFNLPAIPASVGDVTFTSPGATNATYDIFYQLGGTLVNLSLPSSEFSQTVPGGTHGGAASAFPSGTPNFPVAVAPMFWDGTYFQTGRGSIATGQASSPPIVVFSYAYGGSYFVTRTVTNPSAGDLIDLTVGLGSSILFASRLVISSTAAAQVDLNALSTVGVTCTSLTINNLNVDIPNGVNLNDTAYYGCATPPTVLDTMTSVQLGANAPLVYDLTGIVLRPASNTGIAVNLPVGVTGKISVTIWFYQV